MSDEEEVGWSICSSCRKCARQTVCSSGHAPAECATVPMLFKYLGGMNLTKKDPATADSRKLLESLLFTLQKAIQEDMAVEDKEQH